MTQYVRVKFRNSPNTYDYLSDLGLKAGDFAVVPASPGFAVVQVTRVLEESSKATVWVVQKVDVESYQRKQEKRKQVLQGQMHRPKVHPRKRVMK